MCVRNHGPKEQELEKAVIAARAEYSRKFSRETAKNAQNAQAQRHVIK